MRTTIMMIGLALIPVFAWWLRWYHGSVMAPELLRRAHAELDAAGLSGVNVQLDYLDARLTGYLPDPEGRETAEKIVDALPGVRVMPYDNRIRVSAKLQHKLVGQELKLTGWLPGLDAKNAIQTLAQSFRPELKVDTAGIRISPAVELGKPVNTSDGPLPSVFNKVLEDIRLPASLSIKRNGDVYVIKGNLPREELRKAIVDAASQSGWKIDASGLRANPHYEKAIFTESNALADFVSGLFVSPSPGDFEIDQRNGPRLRAYATPAMEAAWLNLLRPVSGATKVEMNITRVPSAFHFPDYKPSSTIDPGLEKDLRALLRAKPVYFPPQSAEIPPEEAVKLGALAAAVFSAGPGAQFIVTGYGDSLLEPGSVGSLRVQRTESVRNRLVTMGVPEYLLETSVFDAVRSPGPVSEEARREARKVELLIK